MSKPFLDNNHEFYDKYYRFSGRSKWMEKIWREAFGDQYPEGIDHYGYVTRHDLNRFRELLPQVPGQTLLDIGCGRGGPGFWLAERLEARLIGVDIVASAIERAHTFQSEFSLAFPAEFHQGHFLELPLEDDSVDCAMSVDSFWTPHDKVKALAEVRRVLKPGGRFVFTHWDLLQREILPFFDQSGMVFIEREDTPNWLEYQEKVYAGINAHKTELVLEMGEASHMLVYEAAASTPYLKHSVRRIYVMEAPREA
ncbi:MAG: class I SAM-dependent methyltransferase [Bacteroidota bacterium]